MLNKFAGKSAVFQGTTATTTQKAAAAAETGGGTAAADGVGTEIEVEGDGIDELPVFEVLRQQLR